MNNVDILSMVLSFLPQQQLYLNRHTSQLWDKCLTTRAQAIMVGNDWIDAKSPDFFDAVNTRRVHAELIRSIMTTEDDWLNWNLMFPSVTSIYLYKTIGHMSCGSMHYYPYFAWSNITSLTLHPCTRIPYCLSLKSIQFESVYLVGRLETGTSDSIGHVYGIKCSNITVDIDIGLLMKFSWKNWARSISCIHHLIIHNDNDDRWEDSTEMFWGLHALKSFIWKGVSMQNPIQLCHVQFRFKLLEVFHMDELYFDFEHLLSSTDAVIPIRSFWTIPNLKRFSCKVQTKRDAELLNMWLARYSPTTAIIEISVAHIPHSKKRARGHGIARHFKRVA